VPAGLGWDFANFYDAGHRVAAGQAQDIYHQTRPIAGLPPQGTMRFWGAPLSAVMFAPLALLPPTIALIVFKVENIAAIGAAVWLLYRHGRRFAPPDPEAIRRFSAVFAVVCLVYQPFWTVFRVGGQSTPTVLLMVVVALVCAMRQNLVAAALLLVAAAMIKPTLVLLIAFLACVSGKRFIMALAAAGACLAALSIGFMGWPLHVEFLRVLQEGAQFSRGWHFNSSLYVPIENLRLFAVPPIGGRTSAALAVLSGAIKVAVSGLLISLVLRSRHEQWSSAARVHFQFIMAVAFWLMVSQTVWEHYLELLFVPLSYFVAVRHRFPPAARRIGAAVFALALGQNLILMEWIWKHVVIESAPALIAIGLLKAGPLLLTLMLLSRYHRALFASYAAPEWTAAVPSATSAA
jgi:glycosyl transferase family 87